MSAVQVIKQLINKYWVYILIFIFGSFMGNAMATPKVVTKEVPTTIVKEVPGACPTSGIQSECRQVEVFSVCESLVDVDNQLISLGGQSMITCSKAIGDIADGDFSNLASYSRQMNANRDEIKRLGEKRLEYAAQLKDFIE